MAKRMIFLFVIFGILLGFFPYVWGADRGEILSGETKIGIDIVAPSYMDTWTFNGSVGDRVIITAVKTSGNLDTEIFLYPPGGGSYEAYTPFSDYLDHQLLTTGQYTILIRDYGLNDAGTYNISFLKIPGTVSSTGDPDGGPIASGETLSGTMNAASDIDAYQFYGLAGDRVIIAAAKTSGNLDTEILLYPPGGGSYEAYTPFSDYLDHQLLTTGLYTILIRDYGLNDAGTYNITFLKIPGPVSSTEDRDGGLIASGQTLSGTINAASDMDAYQFYCLAGDRVIIAAVKTSGNLDTEILLYPPGGGAVEAYTPFSDTLDHQCLNTGLYTILIRDYGLNDAGTYNISFTKIPSDQRPGIYNPYPADKASIWEYNNFLSWDAVTGATGYDLYFGENVVEPLVKIGDNLQTPSMPFPKMQPGQVYYWHVVAHMGAGGDIQGPYWWFYYPAYDFNHDGSPDILWRNTSTGENYVWYMNGVTFKGSAPIMAVSDQNWKIVGVGDFNGDTKPDVLWRNTYTGENYVWYMDGVAFNGSAPIMPVSDQNWKIAGVGDFNNDGNPDILWRNTSTGENYVWYMNGATFLGSAALFTVNPIWQIVGVGDFNGDTKPDILWRNTSTGENYVWYMDGVTFLGSTALFTVNPVWQIVGVGDFNGDTKPDILWRNTSTGENYVWYMNGVTFKGSAPIMAVSDQNWTIVGPK